MHYKQNNKESKTYVQGLRPFGNTLPRGIKGVLKKSGYNYSEIISKWKRLVGKEISDCCYPKSIKTDKDLKDGILFLNVANGDQLDVEYSKKEIIDKINSFFGYRFVKEIRLVLIREKVELKKKDDLDKNQISKYHKKIENIENSELKKKLGSLINVFRNKKI